MGSYLVGIAFDRNSDDNSDDSKPINVRLRALRCLFSVTSKDALEQITGITIDKLKFVSFIHPYDRVDSGNWRLLHSRNYMSALEFVSDLEVLGLTHTLKSFTSCNKLEVVKSVLALKSKTAIRLATRLCQHFGIKSDDIWNNILTKMCSKEMVMYFVLNRAHFLLLR